MFADMHVHTTYSDGTLTPSETINRAKEAGLVAVGVADHDTLEGIPEAEEVGALAGIEIIPAVEINADREDIEIHILAYYPGKNLRDMLGNLRKNRFERMGEMVKKLDGLGLSVSLDRVLQVAGNSAPGRPHLARVLQEEGYVSEPFEAFEKYLGIGKPGYVGRLRPTPSEAVGFARDSGSIAVLAHPGSRAREIVPELLREGLMGLEVYHPSHSEEETRDLLRYCEEENLLVTGGSDSHGPGSGRPYVGQIKVPYLLVERLKEALCR